MPPFVKAAAFSTQARTPWATSEHCLPHMSQHDMPLAMILLVTEMSGRLSLIAPAMLATMEAYVITGDASVYRVQRPTRLDSPAHRDDYALPLMQRVTVRETLDAVGGDPPPVAAHDAPWHEPDRRSRSRQAQSPPRPVLARRGAPGATPASAQH